MWRFISFPKCCRYFFLKKTMIVSQTSGSFAVCYTVTAIPLVWRLLVGGECWFWGGIGVEGH
jgi:hypothetical protein